MLDIIFIFLVAGFVTTLLAGILFIVFKRQLAFNERVNKYFAGPIKKQHLDTLKDSNGPNVKKVLDQYWNKGTDYLNKKVSKVERKN